MRAVGICGTVGRWGWDIDHSPNTASADETLDAQRAMLDAFPPGETVAAWVTLVGHSLASDELLAGAASLAREHGVEMTMHMSPTRSVPDIYLERTGRRPVCHLDDVGVLGRHLVPAHAVRLDDDEADLLLQSGTVDEMELHNKANELAAPRLPRPGITVSHRWPVVAAD